MTKSKLIHVNDDWMRADEHQMSKPGLEFFCKFFRKLLWRYKTNERFHWNFWKALVRAYIFMIYWDWKSLTRSRNTLRKTLTLSSFLKASKFLNYIKEKKLYLILLFYQGLNVFDLSSKVTLSLYISIVLKEFKFIL